MMIKTFFRYLLLIFTLFHSNIATSNNDIYFVDINFLMNNSLAGKSIVKKLDQLTKSNQKKFLEIERKLKEEEIKVISKKNLLSEKDYLKEAQLFTQKVEDYNSLRSKAINDISKKKNKAQKTLIDSLNQILGEYSKKNSISYIIPKKNILIGNTELDLTNIILKILNSENKNLDF